MNEKKIFLILGNQLFPLKYIQEFRNTTFFMAEDLGLCSFQKHHKLKILLFLSAMRSYADMLKKNNYDLKIVNAAIEAQSTVGIIYNFKHWFTKLENFQTLKNNFKNIKIKPKNIKFKKKKFYKKKIK